MTAPADALTDLLGAALTYRRAESPEAADLSLAILAMKLGVALGCTGPEVKEQLDLMRAPPPTGLRMPGGRRRRAKSESLESVVESLAARLEAEGPDAHG